MRPIEFRGKRIDSGEWVYGYLVAIQDLRFAIKDTVYNVNNGRIDIIPSEVDSSTVGQFTGLQDKNGKKIFEGDIVSDECNHGVVFFNEDEAQYQVDFSPIEDCPQEMTKEYNWALIIGNIHDNQELLNQQQ